MHGHLPSSSWNEVIERLRAFERYQTIWPAAAANLRLVAAFRYDRRLADLGRNVSHVSVVLWRPDRPGRVAIVWSEPDGWGWGALGFGSIGLPARSTRSSTSLFPSTMRSKRC